jgi:Ca2+-binding RTX toxin-like protein
MPHLYSYLGLHFDLLQRTIVKASMAGISPAICKLKAGQKEKQMATLEGGAYDDVLFGSRFDDFIRAHGGDDVVFGGQGNDSIFGDDGDDLLFGGKGDDALFGGNGSDILFGDNGDDVLSGGAGDDVLFGGKGDDVFLGGAGNDVLSGDAGSDVLLGGAGNDLLSGGAGDDVLVGGAGNDVFLFTGGGGNDVVLDFTPGEDILQISSGINGQDIHSADDLASRVTQVGNNVVVDLGHGDSVTLVNTSSEDVQAHPDSYFTVH